jgi:hypothetical protein
MSGRRKEHRSMAEKAFEPVGIMAPQIFGLPVDREILFSNHKKVYKKRIEKRQRKLIIKLSFLKPFLKRRKNFAGFNRIFADNRAGSICNGIFICLS